MSYFWDSNEEWEFKRLDGQLYLYVIHRGHQHEGKDPHAHILNLTALNLGETEVEKDLNRFCGMAKEKGQTISYR